MTDAWSRYLELNQQLDQVRFDEEQRTASSRLTAGQVGTRLSELRDLRATQAQELTEISHALKLRQPKLTPIPPAEAPTTASDAVRAAAQAFSEAAGHGRAAQLRARRAGILPHFSTGTRNAAIYGLFAAIAALTGLVRVILNPEGDSGFGVLFAGPFLAFIAGVVTITVWGRIRTPEPVPPPRYGQPTPPDPNRLSARMGLLICFSAPIALLVIVWVLGAVAH